MSHLQSYDYNGWGTWARKNLSYTQAVRVGDRIVCSGQGGWDGTKSDYALEGLVEKNLEGEIEQAFQNVDRALKHAGGKGWDQVYKIVTYSLDIYSQHEFIVNNLKKYMPNHCAVWTEVGCKQLGSPQMNFEIEVEAHDPEGAKKA